MMMSVMMIVFVIITGEMIVSMIEAIVSEMFFIVIVSSGFMIVPRHFIIGTIMISFLENTIRFCDN